MTVVRLRKYFIVEGDHPILRRVYKILYDKDEAISLFLEIFRLNYENITLTVKEEIIK